MKSAARAVALATPLFALGCSDDPVLRGEALVIVDTDLPVPQIVNRLRVDLYTADLATWYVSREIPTLDPSDWPVSFGVHDPDRDAPRTVVLRLRAYQAGVVRDYHGERFTPRPPTGTPGEPSPIAPVPEGETPRLIDAAGADITPLSEPQPWVTVDRLVRIALEPDVRGSVRLVLRGSCAGTMSDLFGGATCIDGDVAQIPRASLEGDMSLPAETQQGSFGAEVPCTAETRQATTLPDGTPLLDEETCVPGRAFVFGSAEAYGRGELSDLPQRIAILPPFRMDRFEVTVGRWRAAVASGFIPPGPPTTNDGPMEFSTIMSSQACTWSSTPMGRETHPLTCLRWQDARAFCAFAGGDLPSEVEWEYVAMDASRDVKTRYPWGKQDPTCERAIFARQVSAPAVFHATDCNHLGPGVPPADAASGDGGDLAIGTGVVNLAGSVSEPMRDAFASLDSACWAAQGLHSPSCVDPATEFFALRGASWASNTAALTGDIRDKLPASVRSPLLGFRCMRAIP